LILKPPAKLPDPPPRMVFLAGSIEMGSAPDWQAQCGETLSKLGYTVLNPRRDDWDTSWEQRASNPQFRGQVEWELDGLVLADAVLMYFAPGTKSPITLLELGLFAESQRLFVCCPDGFWRKGNVELVCERHEVPMLDTIDDLLTAVVNHLKRTEHR